MAGEWRTQDLSMVHMMFIANSQTSLVAVERQNKLPFSQIAGLVRFYFSNKQVQTPTAFVLQMLFLRNPNENVPL